MNDTAVLVLAVLLALAGIFVIPQFMVKRAMTAVIRILRQAGATTPGGAKTDRELGLEPRTFVQRMFRGRDYKPVALKALVDAKIVLTTPDGRFYLVEEKLAGTSLSKK